MADYPAVDLHFTDVVDERAVGHLDLVALLVLGLERHLFVRALGFLEHLGLVLGGHRRGLAVGADEITHAVGFLDQEPDLLGDHAVLIEVELDEDVAGIELAVGLLPHAALHRADALGGDEDPSHDVLGAFDLDLAQQRLAHSIFFVARDSQDEELHSAAATLRVARLSVRRT